MSEELEFSATRTRQVASTPWWTPAGRLLESLVRSIPAHRDTKKGREKGKQVRLFLLVVGVGTIVFAGWPWLLAGIVVMASALLVPMSQMRRRTLHTRLKTARTGHRISEESHVRVAYDGRRVSVLEDGDRLRRVLTDRGEHDIVVGRLDGEPLLGILPASGKRKESIWLRGASGHWIPSGLETTDEIGGRLGEILQADDEDIAALLAALEDDT